MYASAQEVAEPVSSAQLSGNVFSNYLLGRLSASLTRELGSVFSSLPPDPVDYKRNGFQSRFRSFSAFHYAEGAFQEDSSLLKHFNHQKEFHTNQPSGELSSLVDESNGHTLKKLLAEILASSPVKDGTEYYYGINAVRVIANDHFMGAPAPGLHQDGYQFSCHINIARENVSGGMSIIAVSKEPDTTCIRHELQPGEFLFFNDRTLHHTATAVTPMYAGYRSWRDMIIIDIVEKSEAA